jgi:hypothetical protein
MVRRRRSRLTHCVAIAVCALVALARGAQGAPRLGDGTPVPVRLLGLINSETSHPGQPLQFVVISDVMADGELMIHKGTIVEGVVVEVKRARWGPVLKKPKLTFKFTHTTGSNGQVITLRTTPTRDGGDGVVADRTPRHHLMLWAGGSDLFEAYVDGDYDW